MARIVTNHKLHQAALMSVVSIDFDAPEVPQNDELTPEFLSFLCQQRLAGVWLDYLAQTSRFSDTSEAAQFLANECKHRAAQELPQQRVMQLAHDCLTTADIPYFFAKGVHLRKTLYSKPWHRPAYDIDLFVAQADQKNAIAALLEKGFFAIPNEDTDSHELKLTKHGSDVDLHWHLMRPGRYRPGVMRWLFQHREEFDEYFWGLDATASLFVMLVHPPITKYLLSPTSMLIHQVDQLLLMRSGNIDWDKMAATLQTAGLKTAAWSSLYVLKELTGIEPPNGFLKSVEPGNLKSWYLRQWIDRGLITRWFSHRSFTAFGFNLWLQDSSKDVCGALGNKFLRSRT